MPVAAHCRQTRQRHHHEHANGEAQWSAAHRGRPPDERGLDLWSGPSTTLPPRGGLPLNSCPACRCTNGASKLKTNVSRANVRLVRWARLRLWVQVDTDEGLVSLGETFPGPQAVSAYIHESVAPYLLGHDPLPIDRHARALVGQLSRRPGPLGAGDRATALPAPGRPEPGAGPGLRHLRRLPLGAATAPGDGGQLGAAGGSGRGPYEDRAAFLYRADDLAERLLSQGITGMKIWPVDLYAEATGDTTVSGPDLQALEPFRKIRGAVGTQRDPIGEFHALWTLPAAGRTAQALKDLTPCWCEDPIRMDSLVSLAEFAWRACRSARARRRAFRTPLKRRAVGVVMVDIGWVGGQEDRHDGGRPPAAHRLPLHGAGRPDRLGPPRPQHPQRAGSGGHPDLLRRLVPGSGHRSPAVPERLSRATPWPRSGHPAAARPGETTGRHGPVFFIRDDISHPSPRPRRDLQAFPGCWSPPSSPDEPAEVLPPSCMHPPTERPL